MGDSLSPNPRYTIFDKLRNGIYVVTIHPLYLLFFSPSPLAQLFPAQLRRFFLLVVGSLLVTTRYLKESAHDAAPYLLSVNPVAK